MKLSILARFICLVLASAEFVRLKVPFTPANEIRLGILAKKIGATIPGTLRKRIPILTGNSTVEQEIRSSSTEATTLVLSTSSPLAKTTGMVGNCAETSDGVWSGWSYSECTADCGACGQKTRRRACLSFDARSKTGCPCVGLYKISEPCNIGVCHYPRPSCCPPFDLVFLDGHFACGPQNQTVIDDFLKQFGQTIKD